MRRAAVGAGNPYSRCGAAAFPMIRAVYVVAAGVPTRIAAIKTADKKGTRCMTYSFGCVSFLGFQSLLIALHCWQIDSAKVSGSDRCRDLRRIGSVALQSGAFVCLRQTPRQEMGSSTPAVSARGDFPDFRHSRRRFETRSCELSGLSTRFSLFPNPLALRKSAAGAATAGATAPDRSRSP